MTLNIDEFRARFSTEESNTTVTSPQAHHPAIKKAKASTSDRLPKTRKGERFIRGPIPLTWLQIAAACGDRGALVGMLLWYAAGLNCHHEFKFTPSIRTGFTIDPKTVRRVLAKMQDMGLIGSTDVVAVRPQSRFFNMENSHSCNAIRHNCMSAHGIKAEPAADLNIPSAYYFNNGIDHQSSPFEHHTTRTKDFCMMNKPIELTRYCSRRGRRLRHSQ